MTNQGLQELDEEQLHRLRELIRKERKSIVFTHIPEELWQYCENAIAKKRTDDSLLKAVAKWGINVIFSDLNQRFQKACKVTCRNLNQLTKDLDFSPNDTAKGRIDSFLAEVRALFYLSEQKFSDIQPLSRKRKGKQCDFIAKMGSRTFAVEVFHWPEWSGEPELDNLVHDLCNRFGNKKSQLDISLNPHKCEYGLLICVLDRFAKNIKTSRNRFEDALCKVTHYLKWGNQYRFAIVTGYVTNGIPEDTVYPPFE